MAISSFQRDPNESFGNAEASECYTLSVDRTLSPVASRASMVNYDGCQLTLWQNGKRQTDFLGFLI